MHYCPQNTSMTPVWHDKGLCHCFLETVTASVLLGFMLICGSLQWYMYRKYSTKIEGKLVRSSCGYVFQVLFTILLTSEALVHLILRDTAIGDGTIFGYELLTGLSLMVVWIFSLKLMSLERKRILPSIPSRGHGLVLLLFWGLAFVKENVAFVSWWSPLWFWSLSSLQDKLEFGCWVARYACTSLLFIIGLFAPGVPRRSLYGMLNDHQADERRNSRPQSTWKNVMKKLRTMIPYVWPKNNILLQLTVVLCLLLLAAGRVVNVFVPIYYKKIVDSLTFERSTLTDDGKVEQAGPEFRWDLILGYVGLVFLQGGGSGSTGFLNNARTFLWIKVQQYTGRHIQLKLFSHLHALSLRWHLQRKTGEVLRIVDRGRNSINSLLSYVIFNIFPTIIDIIIAIVYFTTTFNYIFGIVVFLCMALYLGCTILVTEWRTKFRREMNTRDNETNARAVDSLLNFETVKYYGASNFEKDRYDEAILRYQKAEWVSTASLNLLNTLQNIVITAGLAVGALLCAWAVYHGINDLHLRVGDYVLFGTYVLQLYAPLNWLGTYYRMIQQAFIDMENMFELLDEGVEVRDIPDAKELKVHSGQIEFRDVCFHYQPEKAILKNISFVVPPGKTYALVGHSGSGKSTIIRLLFRFYDVNGGSIRIDGTDIALVQQESLRQSIGVVPQDTVLFNNDIRYNIRYGRQTANDDEVEDSADAADIHSRIQTFPNGYNTVVGERGLKLSGGEKQRVAIARTLLKAPTIVLLDEATSALDTKTERNIQSSLARVCENKTSIIVAHRLSTIIHSHQILVLSEGEIIERGTHEELIALDGSYAEMWQQQQMKADEENDNNVNDETDNVEKDD